jgi:hypothetical protein
MAEIDKPKERQIAPKNYPYHVTWNTLFRAIGINGCVDSGLGIIHTSEPYQAVFFDIGAVDVIKRVHNRSNYTPGEIDKNIDQGQQNKTVMTNQFERFRRMSFDDQVHDVLQKPQDIRFMPNPPEFLQVAACKKDGRAIAGIRNPSEQLQLEVVNKHGGYIAYVLQTVRKPSQAVQIAALKGRSSDTAMMVFDKILAQGIWPTPAVQMAAVSQDFTKTLELLAKYKINPSEQVKQAVEQELERRKYW